MSPLPLALPRTGMFSGYTSPRTHHNFLNTIKMTTTPPLLDFQYLPGYEIPMKYKEAIRQLHWFGHIPVLMIQA
jgi:hypothetical protein